MFYGEAGEGLCSAGFEINMMYDLVLRKERFFMGNCAVTIVDVSVRTRIPAFSSSVFWPSVNFVFVWRMPSYSVSAEGLVFSSSCFSDGSTRSQFTPLSLQLKINAMNINIKIGMPKRSEYRGLLLIMVSMKSNIYVRIAALQEAGYVPGEQHIEI